MAADDCRRDTTPASRVAPAARRGPPPRRRSHASFSCQPAYKRSEQHRVVRSVNVCAGSAEAISRDAIEVEKA